jgi:8-amino-7-oxononanoate synthase
MADRDGSAPGLPSDDDWRSAVEGQLAAIRHADRWRQIRDFTTTGAMVGSVDGRDVVSFAANDYLGLTHHPRVRAAARDAAVRWGTGSGASRLVVGSRPIHTELEGELAAWKRTDAALLFPTGYAANLGVLTVFGGNDVTVLSDELNHASIIDGSRLARADVRVYRHRDLDHLAALLEDVDGRALIVSDSVFSMDGDAADLAGLSELADRSGALLVLDEAHAVYGPHLPADRTGSSAPVLRVGTLSKTLGSLGGFVAGPRPFIDLLVNAARPFIFTTAPAPGDVAAASAALQVVQSPEGDVLVGKLRRHVDRIVDRLGERVASPHPSPIVPVLLGDEETALTAAAKLLERGLLVPAIRPPTVAPGTSRLRIALSAAHEGAHVDRLLSALEEILP